MMTATSTEMRRADQHPAEQVPPEVVGAEPVVDRRGLEHGEQVDLVRVLRRDERAEHREQQDQRDDRDPGHVQPRLG